MPLVNPSDEGSTLRARLSSQPPPARPDAELAKHLQPVDVYQHFRDCFVPSPAPVNAFSRDEFRHEHDLMVALGESVAKAGFELHGAVVERLSRAQAEILARINAFSKSSSAILSDLDDLYSNIAYPLSASLCHSANFPRATLGTHFVSVQAKLKAAEGELTTLRGRWDDNVRQEEKLRQEIASETVAQQPESQQVEAFRLEAERIAREQLRALDDIEAHYKELMQAKTMEMMQFMLAD